MTEQEKADFTAKRIQSLIDRLKINVQIVHYRFSLQRGGFQVEMGSVRYGTMDGREYNPFATAKRIVRQHLDGKPSCHLITETNFHIRP